ncbi:MAG: NAD(P)H-hydrate dehydratase, partial [Lachnospiraceae bacterium]|nr:NAD(P)H-hydrate dehydratase [Lachnospiraceae bacterium]
TFGEGKLGHFLYPGAHYAGKVFIEEIGFPKEALEKTAPKHFFYHPEDVKELFPKRIPNSHKGSYGKLLVIAGSEDISGAAFFAAKAAYLMGCGLVKVVTHENNRSMLQEKLPEALHAFYGKRMFRENEDGEEGIPDLREDISWASAVVTGPGLGTDAAAKALLAQVLEIRDKPVLIDADGINLLAGEERYVKNGELFLPENFILTPHMLEMSRLTGTPLAELKAHPLEYVKKTREGAVFVLKDARTLVSDGEWVYVNVSGNSALSKGGSGDVLSGMIGGLLARGVERFLAAALGVYLHGLTAEEYIKDRSSSSMLASDILEMLPRVLP